MRPAKRINGQTQINSILRLSKANNKHLKETHHIPSLYTLPQGLSAFPQVPTPETLRTRHMRQQLNKYIISVQSWQSHLV